MLKLKKAAPLALMFSVLGAAPGAMAWNDETVERVEESLDSLRKADMAHGEKLNRFIAQAEDREEDADVRYATFLGLARMIEDNKEAHEALLHFFARQVGDPISDIAYERTMTWALKDLVLYGNDAIRAASLTVLEDETLLGEAHRVDAALRACADIVDQYYNSSHQAEIVSDTLDSITRILSASTLEGFDSHTAAYIERRLEDARLRISYDAFFNDSPQEGEELSLLEQKLEAVMAQFRAKAAPAAEAAPAPAP